ncbi:hypothetical protein bcere0004_52950 [Bacillus cereus BGSC 6E1]|nr:hypothetical protein bcere0004_52950 [Bacillus cereus BGSC 6E1]
MKFIKIYPLSKLIGSPFGLIDTHPISSYSGYSNVNSCRCLASDSTNGNNSVGITSIFLTFEMLEKGELHCFISPIFENPLYQKNIKYYNAKTVEIKNSYGFRIKISNIDYKVRFESNFNLSFLFCTLRPEIHTMNLIKTSIHIHLDKNNRFSYKTLSVFILSIATN